MGKVLEDEMGIENSLTNPGQAEKDKKYELYGVLPSKHEKFEYSKKNPENRSRRITRKKEKPGLDSPFSRL